MRALKVTLSACLVLIGACERATPPIQPAGVVAAGSESANDSVAFPDSENPRCLRTVGTDRRCEEYRVSLVELLANPIQWHGKDVVVIGFAAVSFEHSAIYLHRQDMEAGIAANGLWLELPKDLASGELEKGTYVLVRGKFDARAGGHMGAFNGTIRANHVQLWGD